MGRSPDSPGQWAPAGVPSLPREAARPTPKIGPNFQGVRLDYKDPILTPRIVEALFACRGDLEQIRQKGLGVSLVAAVDDMVNKFK